MANRARTARRAAERNRVKSTREIPDDVRARLAQIKGTGGATAPPGVRTDPPGNGAPTGGAEHGANAPPVDDPPPGIPEGLPPELTEMLAQAQRTSGAGVPGAVKPAGRRDKKFSELEKELAVLLTLPGPFFEGGGDHYCATHFMMQGPLLANRLTVYAETNPATYDLLIRIVAAGGFAVVAMAIFAYALPPMMHHGLPAPAGLKKMYHVPEKHSVEPEDVEGGDQGGS